MRFVLGLTGSIGMGKSTTAAMFREEGVPVWDADASVHALYAPGGAAVPGIRALVPRAVAGGEVDRPALREALERDPTLFPRLEALVHPLVAEDRARFLGTTPGDIVVLDVPLLYEREIDRECDEVAVVSASAATQMARLLARPGMDLAGVELLLSRQMPDAEKRARARWVIPTETLEEARAAVRQILSEIRADAG
ncbi:Dephospho-CoA kinase [Rubellimicrobium mesophilum DSM 19309]|uniref:Dephospho-CoA kinase n=1 Tax=Rubellimicrobium mesophilum DSM 19309 TaxID=442562 RepID=A0A017HK63_9RHOB|nr:dephospho-CoA kinase [Rubellimicrobium mesophilum]EYD74159.1 Dephospho-CoA kinase [Rubellimicrobium mesophilum DSM 19309]